MRLEEPCLATSRATVTALVAAVIMSSSVPQQAGSLARAHQAQGSGTAGALAVEREEGIPIRNVVVQKTCATCHTIDEKQQISRISFQRRTPEGWQATVRRMAALNGMNIDPDTARDVVKYLSNNLGLAPEEAKPAAFDAERRLIDYKYSNADAEAVCTKCHSIGRVISQRRSNNEWHLLISLHRGLYPLIDSQVFRRSGSGNDAAGPGGRASDTRHPVQKAVAHLAEAFPLNTKEWSAWSATMRPPRLEGTWSVRGWEAGKGPFYGRAEIKAVTDPKSNSHDEFTMEAVYTFASTGQRVTRAGRTVIYTGYQWRGRSTERSDESTALREVMWVDRDWKSISGRWYTGGYDELGLDVQLERIGAETSVLGTDRTALAAGVSGQLLKIYGTNLPTPLQPSAVDLGPGITLTQIVSATRDVATLTLDVDSDAGVGARDLVIRGASRPRAFTVYDRVDRIKVTPEWAMARVGGIVFPKMMAQFEARAFHNGPDNRPETSDDVDLGVVPVTWSLEEYAVRYGDDDVSYVGTIDPVTGRFTPNVDGPNPARRGSANNIGDVWVVARYTPDRSGSKPASPLTARAHLLVTVPLYMRWEPPPAR
jgi:quinohemoprotein amine dehydrogenase